MKAFLPDGQVIEGPVPKLCIGYVTERLEIEPDDIDYLRVLAARNPDEFQAVMWQLANRFRTRRFPYPEGKGK